MRGMCHGHEGNTPWPSMEWGHGHEQGPWTRVKVGGAPLI